MAGKIAIINHEFEQLTTQLKQNHQTLIEAYKKIIQEANQLSSSSGSFQSDKVSPKIQGLMDGVSSDIISRLETTFEQTEMVIKDFETVIVNVDTSC